MSTNVPELFRTRAIAAIRNERARQVDTEGYSIQHDAEHGPSTLALAAYAYSECAPGAWPWAPDLYKPKGAVRDLVRAGALFLAARDVVKAGGGRRTDIDIGLADVTDRLARTLHEAAEVLA